MGDKEFHEMLGVLFDYDTIINDIAESKNREEALRSAAQGKNINLEDADIRDIANVLDKIADIKGKGLILSPRN